MDAVEYLKALRMMLHDEKHSGMAHRRKQMIRPEAAVEEVVKWLQDHKKNGNM